MAALRTRFLPWLASWGIAVLAAPGAEAAPQEFLTVEQALALAFPDADRVEPRTAILLDGERAALEPKLRARKAPRIVKFFEGSKAGRLLGYALVDDVPGKSRPITYLLSVDPRLEVRRVEILTYRESHGGEIRREKFREQFVGKSRDSPLRLNGDIRNVTGATISCRALTDGVHDLLALLEVACPLARPREQQVEGPTPAAAATARKDAPDGSIVRTQLLMGTTLRIQLFARDRDQGNAACDAAFAEVARLEALLSPWRQDSELSALGAAAGGKPVPVSGETFELLQTAQELARESDGAFDACCGALVALWRSASAQGLEPAPAEIERARALCGPAQLALDGEHRTARLATPGAMLDPGAIGKGYALDRAARELERRGIRSALLDFGGQLLALDAPPASADRPASQPGQVSTGWIVEVRDPRGSDRPLARLRLARASVSTTSDDQRGLRLGSTLVSHVVDPRTGRPASGVASATVVTERATLADAWSTALFVLGAPRALALANERDLGVLLLTSEGAFVRSGALARWELPPGSDE